MSPLDEGQPPMIPPPTSGHPARADEPPPKRVIPNKGSTARDHLANERTFLAWLRTTLGLVGLGVVLGRVGLLEDGLKSDELRFAGMALVTTGAGLLVYGLQRYRRVAQALQAGRFPVATNGPLWLSVLIAGVVVLSFALLW